MEGNVEIGEGALVEPFCTVGPDVVIGRGSVIRSGARIYPRVSIGEESVIGANAVIGSEGFGFVRDEAGNKTRIPHLGGIIIGSHVEIGALSVVQYGTISPAGGKCSSTNAGMACALREIFSDCRNPPP